MFDRNLSRKVREAYYAVILEKELSLKVIPQGIGILVGMIFNFIFSNFLVFKNSKKGSINEQ